MTLPAATALEEDDCEAAAGLGRCRGHSIGGNHDRGFMYAHPRPYLADACIEGLMGQGYALSSPEGSSRAVRKTAFRPRSSNPSAGPRGRRATSATMIPVMGRITFGNAPCLVWMCPMKLASRGRGRVRGCDGSADHVPPAETSSFRVEQTRTPYGMRETAFPGANRVLAPDLLAVHCVNARHRR
jgi:hypothetical protein